METENCLGLKDVFGLRKEEACLLFQWVLISVLSSWVFTFILLVSLFLYVRQYVSDIKVSSAVLKGTESFLSNVLTTGITFSPQKSADCAEMLKACLWTFLARPCLVPWGWDFLFVLLKMVSFYCWKVYYGFFSWRCIIFSDKTKKHHSLATKSWSHIWCQPQSVCSCHNGRWAPWQCDRLLCCYEIMVR